MKHVIIGMGEIGTAIKGLFPDATTVDIKDPNTGLIENKDVMHICFPYGMGFVTEVMRYISVFRPIYTIIYSTVPVGVTEKIPEAVHSPVEGRHPDLELSIRQMVRWIGHSEPEVGMFFKNLFWNIGIKSRLVSSPRYTEALKLLSTSEYGVNLLFADYKAKVAEMVGMDYELTKEWNRDYNKLYRDLGEDKRFQKYVLDPPNGKIGGHCVVPNADLLNSDFPNEMLEMLRRAG